MVYTFNHPPRPSGWQGHAREAEKQERDAEYPQRAGEPDCSYYVKFGSCKYGMSCRFNHPMKPSGWQGRHARASEKQELGSEYPRRPGEPDCSYYMKFGSCKYGMDCIFNHPLHEPMAKGRESFSNEAFSSKYEQLFPGRGHKCSHHGGGKTEFEKVKLNFLGLPLRQGTGVCSYYVRTGICKFGTNCKFHHPEPGSEHENWEASRHVIQGSSQQNFYSVLIPEELNEQPVPFSVSSPSRRKQGIILPHGTNPYPESSEYQFGGSRCETVKRVRYTRDQLLGLHEALQIIDVSKDILELKQGIDVQLRDADGNWVHTDSNVQTQAYNRYDLKDNREWRSRSSRTPNIINEEKSWDNIHEVKESYASSGKQEQFYKHGQLSIQFDSKAEGMMDCGKLYIAPLNVRLPNTMSGEMKMMDSSSRAPETYLAESTTIRSNEGSGDENYVGTVDKDVHKRSEEVILRESSNEEPNSVKPQKNYANEESSHMVDFSENVSRSNSSASLSISRVGCSISEIMGLVVDAGAEEGSDEHFIATQLFIRPEYREVFLTHTPQGRLGWLRRMCQLKK